MAGSRSVARVNRLRVHEHRHVDAGGFVITETSDMEREEALRVGVAR